MTDTIPPEQLEKGRIYKFHARNFRYGAWNGESEFIGIREKFSDKYLFGETHWELGGTVAAITATDYRVPEDIEVREYTDSYCAICGVVGVEWVRDDPTKEYGGKGIWRHTDRSLDGTHEMVHGVHYASAQSDVHWPLFNVLAPLYAELGGDDGWDGRDDYQAHLIEWGRVGAMPRGEERDRAFSDMNARIQEQREEKRKAWEETQ